MTLHTSADIVGAGAKVALAATALKARRIMLCAHGSSNARFGDTNVAAAQGVELPADTVVQVTASEGDITDLIDLSAAFVFVPVGTTITVAYGT